MPKKRCTQKNHLQTNCVHKSSCRDILYTSNEKRERKECVGGKEEEKEETITVGKSMNN